MTTITIRAGDAIGMPGYDGRTDSTLPSPYVPIGLSVWEFGTSGDPEAKAQEDYRTRSADPLDVEPAKTTFVFVSMQRFREKDAWAARRRAEHRWREIRVLDADDLHAWLESTPSVHTWASEQLGLRPQEVTTLQRWWQIWTAKTQPPTPADLLLAGRKSAARELRKALTGTHQPVGVCAGSREEALAFAAAALLLNDAEGAYVREDSLLSTALIVESSREWSRIVALPGRVVLIPHFEDADVAGALTGGHSVLVPMGPGQVRSRAQIALPAIARDEAREVIQRTFPGQQFEDADRLAGHARRSLASFRRTHAINPSYEAPAWAKRPIADLLAPLVLVGSWDAESTSDQDAVAAVTGRHYADIERELRFPADPEDAPFVRSGNTWQLTSAMDAWTLLRSALTREDLSRWRTEAVRVLAEEDPTSGMPGEERLLAAILQRFDPDAVDADVNRSIAARNVIREAMRQNGTTWDYEPRVDPGTQYWRSD